MQNDFFPILNKKQTNKQTVHVCFCIRNIIFFYISIISNTLFIRNRTFFFVFISNKTFFAFGISFLLEHKNPGKKHDKKKCIEQK